MESDQYIAVFDTDAYLLAETEPAEGQIEMIETLEPEYENRDGYVIGLEEAADAGILNPEEVLEQVYDERPEAFGFLDGEVGEGVEDAVGEDASIFAKHTVAERLVDDENYDWRNTDLSNAKLVVGEEPRDVWSSYRRNTRQEPSLDLGLPRDQVGVKSD